MKNSCCMNCDKRFPGCHDTCTDYQQFKKLHEEERAFNRKVFFSLEGICRGANNWRGFLRKGEGK